MAICGCTGGGATTCEAIAACLRPFLGRGLRWNATTNRFEVCLSRDVGNSLSYGTDNCLYAPSGSTPPPDTGRKSIATLPDFVFGGLNCAGLLYPYNATKGIDHVIDNNIDIVDSWTVRSVDGIALWSPYPNGQENISYYTTSLSTSSPNLITATTWSSLFSDAGNPYVATSQNSPAPTAMEPTGRDQNWWGWHAPTQYLRTVAAELRHTAARAVVILRTDTSADTPSAIDAVRISAAEDWVIIATHETVTGVSDIIAAGMTPAVNIDANTTITPTDVLASGAQWVLIRWDQTQTRIQSFITAGLEVIVINNSTHYNTNLWRTNGARGVLCWDPVYARGALGTGFYSYRTNPDYTTRMPQHGHLTVDTNRFAGITGRGFSHTDLDGQYEEARYNWPDSSTPMNYAQTGQTYNPIPGYTSYTISWEDRVVGALPNQNFTKMGAFIGFADDRVFSTLNATVAQPGINGYHCFVRCGTGTLGGQLVIGRIDNGLYTELATSVSRIAFPADTWVVLRVRVTPTSIIMERGSTTVDSATANDTTYRGMYFKRSKEESATGTFLRCTRRWTLTNNP